MTKLKRFTNPDVLKTINTRHLAKFFDLFKDEFAAVPISVPTELPGSDAYLGGWIAILNHPEKLPQLFIQALLVIENLAAIQNRRDLDAAVQHARIGSPWLDPGDSPEYLALQVWLLARYGDQDWMKEDPRIECRQTYPLPPDPAACDAEPTRPPGSARTQPLETDEPALVSSLEDQATATDPVFSQPLPLEEAAREMNATCEPITLQPLAAPTPLPSTINTELSTNFRRHTGTVGRLPHQIRESINLMIYDGVPYAAIIESLGEAGKEVTRYHITRWKKHGYQEWLKEQERRALTRSKQQFAFDILREKDSGKLHEASLQIASSHLGQFLADFDSTVLREKLQADPLNFVRLLNALSKLSESGIKCEAHRVEMAERCEAVKRAKIPPRELGLSDEVRRIIEEERFDPPPN